MECSNVGETNADVAGLGVIAAFATQAGLSIIVSICAFILGSLLKWHIFNKVFKIDLDPAFWTLQHRYLHWRLSLALESADAILRAISEVQTINGIALIIAAIIQDNSLSLYHKHVVYDTANFTGVSFCASLLVLWVSEKNEMRFDEHGFITLDRKKQLDDEKIAKKPIRNRWLSFLSRLISNEVTVIIFSILYLTYVVLFDKSLAKWDYGAAGFCYSVARIASPGVSHPYVDKVYLGITSAYMFLLLILCLALANLNREWFEAKTTKIALAIQNRLHSLLGSGWSLPLGMMFGLIFSVTPWLLRFSVVLTALLQYPLHLYMIIALRTANEKFLTGESENNWGFGQLIALILIIPVLKEFVKGYIEYQEKKANWLKINPREVLPKTVDDTGTK